MMLRRGAVPVILLALSIVAFAQQGPRQDGRWEVKMEMSMPGMPMQMPPFTSEQCVTPEDVSNPQAVLPQAQGPGGRGGAGDCAVSDYKLAGHKVTWNMKCEGQMAMVGTGEMVYSENAYEGLMKMNVAAMNMDMTMKINGKRLGDCVK